MAIQLFGDGDNHPMQCALPHQMMHWLTIPLVRYVGFHTDAQPYILDKPHSDADSQLHHFLAEDRESLRDPVGTTDWIRGHWEKVRGLERQRIKAITEGAAEDQLT